MKAVWQTQGGFISELLANMAEPKLPYTTLASVIKNLEKKGFVTAHKMGNAYRYIPRIEQTTYQTQFLKDFLGHYFKSSYKELVAFFIQQKEISAQELKEMVDLIEKQPPP